MREHLIKGAGEEGTCGRPGVRIVGVCVHSPALPQSGPVRCVRGLALQCGGGCPSPFLHLTHSSLHQALFRLQPQHLTWSRAARWDGSARWNVPARSPGHASRESGALGSRCCHHSRGSWEQGPLWDGVNLFSFKCSPVSCPKFQRTIFHMKSLMDRQTSIQTNVKFSLQESSSHV
uniref:uncharacterized protein LOC114671803 n=1 Tax=Macaca mulatta TaxID=9544 RepID=UPI0010A26751|nr:uncharacterized protein LOC114671803 [Macaca mulatta]